MEDLVILDYNNSTLHFYKVDSNADIDYNYIEKLGLNPDDCSWICAEDIEVIKHKGVLI